MKKLTDIETLLAAARVIRDAYRTDPGTWDLDNEQDIHIHTTLGAWRKLDLALNLALAGTNYVCDHDTFPQRVEFANGRVVKMVGQGHLFVGWKE